MLRILIVDDQKSIRETIKAALESESDLEVVATASNGENAIELAKALLPDLMLVDLEMPGMDGLSLTRSIYQDFPSIKVIVLSMHDREEYIQQSLQAGAMGYLLKNTPAKDLREALRFVSRGYTQFSPGLLSKVVPFVETQPVDRATAGSNNSSRILGTLKSLAPKYNTRQTRKSWKKYLPYWIVGNVALWGLAILYLAIKSPTYTSKWTVSLPASENSSSVSIPDIGSVSSNSESPYRSNLFDPRENYKYLLREKETLTTAARQLGMKRSEFGKPEIEIVDNTTMMELSVEGDSPEEAQEKAIALQAILERKLNELRQGQIGQTDRSLQASLEKSERSLIEARQRLANYKLESAIGSSDREANLSSNLENLRRQQAEAKAELEQLTARARQLADNLGISARSAKDAFTLHSDSLFQQHLVDYTRTSAELINLEAKFQASNPLVVEKQAETDAAQRALIQRGTILLGRTPSSELLQQLNLRTGNDNDSYRGSLLKDIVSLQSEALGLSAKVAELDRQVANLETKENNLVQQRSALARLEQDIKLAETVYSSNLAKSRLAESNLYDAYPQIQVAIAPSSPTKPSSPNPTLVFLGTFMSSVFLTTAIASLWITSTETRSPATNGKNHNAIAPGADLNSLLRK